MTVRLSPTSLDKWFTSGCPKAWDYSRSLTDTQPNIHLLLGNAVHGLMDGRYNPDGMDEHSAHDLPGLTPEIFKMAVMIYRKMVAIKTDLGLTVLLDSHNLPLIEKKYVHRLLPGIDYVCKIDMLAIDYDGVPVVVDWKSTMGNGWKQIAVNVDESVTPQRLAFQSISYLITPPKRVRDAIGLPLNGWPKKLYYIVGPARGPCQIYPYEWKDEDYDNFKTALQMAATAIRANHFPKIKGKHCLDCDWKSPCYGTEGWQERFKPYRSEPAQPEPA